MWLGEKFERYHSIALTTLLAKIIAASSGGKSIVQAHSLCRDELRRGFSIKF